MMIKKVLLLTLLMFGTSFGVTKQEALTAMSAKFVKVGEPRLAQDTLPGYNVRWYQVPVLMLVNDSIPVGKSINMYVKDEGLASEFAFVADPTKPPRKQTFVQAVESYVKSKGMLLIGVGEAHPKENWAVVDVFEIDGTTTMWVRKQVIVQKSGGFMVHRDVQ